MASFPGSVPSLPRPTSTTAMNASGYEGDVVIDLISDEVEAIATELGTDPAGAQATVKARLEHMGRFATAGGAVWVSGGYIAASYTGGSVGATTLGAATQFYWPWWCPKDVTVDRIAVEVTTLGSGANARLAIYGVSADGGPGDLIVDGGEIDCSTTGVKELTISQSLTVGGYWLSLLNESSVGYRGQSITGHRLFGGVTGTTVYSGAQASQSRTYTSGVLATAAAWGSLTLSSSVPLFFWLRRT